MGLDRKTCPPRWHWGYEHPDHLSRTDYSPILHRVVFTINYLGSPFNPIIRCSIYTVGVEVLGVEVLGVEADM